MDLITKHNLYIDIHRAIEASICGLTSKQEPDYIAALTTKLPHELRGILNRNIPTMQFNVDGCFIHQKPLAKFCAPGLKKMKSPEIGDLLIVYKEILANGDCLYNALLLQAKKTDDIYYTPIHPNDKHQLLLYTKWPKFQYQRAGSLNGHIRSINPKTITPGAQYLLIDEHNKSHSPLGPCTFWCAKAADILMAANSLSHQIVDFIDFQTGKPFVSLSIGMDHWSKMIWDLITISANSHFNRRATKYDNHPRLTSAFLSTLANPHEGIQVNNGAGDNFGGDNKENNMMVDNEYNIGGISILYIEGKSQTTE